MNRQELEKYILDTYGVSPEYPWIVKFGYFPKILQLKKPL